MTGTARPPAVAVPWRPAVRAADLAVALAAVLLAAGLVTLWSAPPPRERLWWVIWELVLGAGFAVAGRVCVRVPGGRVPGRLFLAAGTALLAAPVLLAAGAPVVGDVAALTAAAVLLPLGVLRIVPHPAGAPPVVTRLLRGLEAAVAGCGVAVVALGAGGRPAAAGWVAFAGSVLVFAAGWVLFECTAEDQRRQVLWLVLGLGTGVPGLGLIGTAADPWDVNAATVAALMASTSLVLPLSAAVAVVAPRAVDVRTVISRTVVLAVMTALVITLSALTDVGFRLLADDEPPPGYRGVVVLVIALGFQPARRVVSELADELLFGGRADPVDTLSRLGGELTAGTSPREWLGTLRAALAVPGIALREADGTVTQAGELDETRVVVTELRAGEERVGELVAGVPRDRLALDPATRAVLGLVAAPLAQAVRAERLGEQLRASRGRVVAALEEERRRVRRDLHDGLGPTLTGIAYSAEAAINLAATDPDAAAEVLRGLRADAGEAIAEVRRIVYGLRPKALDELGLAGAVRQRVEHLRTPDGRPLRVGVAATALPELPAAVEVAAYRVAVEAVTNVARHAGVDAAEVEFGLRDEELRVVVTDRGVSAAPWRPGVGIGSMRERAESAGGWLIAAGGPDGGRVEARLPLRPPAQAEGTEPRYSP